MNYRLYYDGFLNMAADDGDESRVRAYVDSMKSNTVHLVLVVFDEGEEKLRLRGKKKILEFLECMDASMPIDPELAARLEVSALRFMAANPKIFGRLN